MHFHTRFPFLLVHSYRTFPPTYYHQVSLFWPWASPRLLCVPSTYLKNHPTNSVDLQDFSTNMASELLIYSRAMARYCESTLGPSDSVQTRPWLRKSTRMTAGSPWFEPIGRPTRTDACIEVNRSQSDPGAYCLLSCTSHSRSNCFREA